MLKLYICAVRGVGGLLQEDGVACDFADVDGDGEALAGEYGVHYGDVLRGEIAGDGEDEYAGVEGGRGCWVCC